MPDDRDKFTRKRPPPHVRAQTAQPAPPRASYTFTDPACDPAAPDREMDDFESETPVFPQMEPPLRDELARDPAAVLARVEWRQKRQSTQMVSVRDQAAAMRGELAEVKAESKVLTGMLAKALDDAAAERRARIERDAARELEKDKARIESRKITLSIVVPTITALGAAIAALVAALK